MHTHIKPHMSIIFPQNHILYFIHLDFRHLPKRHWLLDLRREDKSYGQTLKEKVGSFVGKVVIS